jgi:hypothetical protein
MAEDTMTIDEKALEKVAKAICKLDCDRCQGACDGPPIYQQNAARAAITAYEEARVSAAPVQAPPVAGGTIELLAIGMFANESTPAARHWSGPPGMYNSACADAFDDLEPDDRKMYWDRARSLLAASPPPPQIAWQDIETAPSDGRPLLVRGGSCRGLEVRQADGGFWRSKQARAAPTEFIDLAPLLALPAPPPTTPVQTEGEG